MQKTKWVKGKAILTKDLLIIDSFQVMQKWESNYMKMLASIVTKNGGTVLEIGYGMGISAAFIQKSPKIKKHVIIEAHPNVFNYANRRLSSEVQRERVKIIKGFWQDVTKKLKSNSFDGILFDDFPLSKHDNGEEILSMKESYRLLKEGGILTYYDSEKSGLSRRHIKELKRIGFRKINYKICKVKPPKYCRYWKHNTITAPVIIK